MHDYVSYANLTSSQQGVCYALTSNIKITTYNIKVFKPALLTPSMLQKNYFLLKLVNSARNIKVILVCTE